MNDLATLMGDGPAIHMARQVTSNIKVSREGLLIVLQIGNSVLRLKYQDAMQIGQWMMTNAHEAKFLDGNNKRIIIEK